MAAAAPANQPPALSFPRPIFAALSPHPFLQAHLSNTSTGSHKANATTALRANGRTANESRQPGVNSGSLTHCNGSAVVRLGNTAVVCGIRAEILKAEDISSGPSNPNPTPSTSENDEEDEDDTSEIEALRLLVPNIELSTGSTPQHLPGNAPSTYAQTLLTRLRNLLLSSRLLRAKDLRIIYTPSASPDFEPSADAEEEIKAYWTLYIDTLFISLDGSAFDAAFLAIVSALRNLRLPHAYYDEEAETILCSDDPAQARSLNLRGLPVPSTFAVFEAGKSEDGEEGHEWVLSDPDAFEEGVCQESVCVIVDCSKGGKAARGGKGEVVRRIEKSGGGVVGRVLLKGLVKRSVERWEVWERVFKESA